MYEVLPESERQCFGPLNHFGKSHRSAGGVFFSVIIREPTYSLDKWIQNNCTLSVSLMQTMR